MDVWICTAGARGYLLKPVFHGFQPGSNGAQLLLLDRDLFGPIGPLAFCSPRKNAISVLVAMRRL
jgi:hypothetical protein